jgi:hypothetical protein
MKHSIGKVLTPATPTTIFTVPQGYVAEVDMLFVSNHTSSSKTIDITWESVVPLASIDILYQKSLNAKEFLQFSDGSIVLREGDSLTALAETGSDYTVIVTFDLRKEKPLYAFI